MSKRALSTYRAVFFTSLALDNPQLGHALLYELIYKQVSNKISTYLGTDIFYVYEIVRTLRK